MSASVAIRERPILFSGPMVRAILDGRKTQTRRVVQPQPWEDVGTLRVGVYHPEIVVRGEYEPGPEEFGAWSEDGEFAVRCRYGAPGDRLWVREAHALESYERIVYRADRAAQYVQDFPFGGMGRFGHMFWLSSDYEPDRWRPSIHMPRWASRLTLEITDVRVERVQEISESDAEAEGLTKRGHWWDVGSDWKGDGLDTTASGAFRMRWDALNAKRGYGWDANPWVWCLAFKVVQ